MNGFCTDQQKLNVFFFKELIFNILILFIKSAILIDNEKGDEEVLALSNELTYDFSIFGGCPGEVFSYELLKRRGN